MQVIFCCKYISVAIHAQWGVFEADQEKKRLEMFAFFFCVCVLLLQWFPAGSCRWRCSFLCRTFCLQLACFNLCLKSQAFILLSRGDGLLCLSARPSSVCCCWKGTKKWPLSLDLKQIYVKLLESKLWLCCFTINAQGSIIRF